MLSVTEAVMPRELEKQYLSSFQLIQTEAKIK